MTKDLTFALLIVLAASAAEARSRPRGLAAEIEAILNRPAFAPALVGVEIRDLGSGATIFAKNAEIHVKPASTAKLFTTAAALDLLGPEATVETTLESAGRLDGLGRVLGDVYFIGRGDPNLSDRFDAPGDPNPIERLAREIRAAGIRRIEGRLIGHDGLFPGDTIGDGWTADDLVWPYGAEFSALLAFDGAIRLRITPGERVGDPAWIERRPSVPDLDLRSSVTTVAAGAEKRLLLTRPLGSRAAQIVGEVPLGASDSFEGFAVPEPARFATELLLDALGRAGVTVASGVARSRAALPPGLRVLAFHRGRPVRDEIRVVNKESQNQHAEILLRRSGLAGAGDGGIEKSREAREKVVRGLGVRGDLSALWDGSGLSRAALVSARAEVDLLAAMARHPHATAFRDSLPIAGVDGSLRRRMKGTAAEGRVFAKTGSIRHVAALAGYIDTASGRRLAFAVIANHFTGPSREINDAIDEICALVASR